MSSPPVPGRIRVAGNYARLRGGPVGSPPMADQRRRGGRISRSTRIGAVAAGHAARTLRTRAANIARTDDERREAMGREALETADRLVTVLGTMKGAAMKLGQT